MATINMEVEVTTSLKTTMDSQKQTMESKLGELTNTITSMIGQTWQGASAQEFGGQYESLRSAVTGQLGKILELSAKLQSEITQWVDAASKMG
jgi:uncharacterized protein YukE